MGKRKKRIKKAIASLEKTKEGHIEKKDNEPESLPAKTGYWDKEISNLDVQIEKMKKRLERKLK